jgi:elongation factor 1-beta
VLPVQRTEHPLYLPEMWIWGTVRLKKALKEKLPGIQDMQIEPIGFGLKVIKLAAVINDCGGETDAIEKSLNDIDGVERAEIIEVTLN